MSSNNTFSVRSAFTSIRRPAAITAAMSAALLMAAASPAVAGSARTALVVSGADCQSLDLSRDGSWSMGTHVVEFESDQVCRTKGQLIEVKTNAREVDLFGLFIESDDGWKLKASAPSDGGYAKFGPDLRNGKYLLAAWDSETGESVRSTRLKVRRANHPDEIAPQDEPRLAEAGAAGSVFFEYGADESIFGEVLTGGGIAAADISYGSAIQAQPDASETAGTGPFDPRLRPSPPSPLAGGTMVDPSADPGDDMVSHDPHGDSACHMVDIWGRDRRIESLEDALAEADEDLDSASDAIDELVAAQWILLQNNADLRAENTQLQRTILALRAQLAQQAGIK